MNKQVAKVLSKQLGDYVEGINKDSVQVSMFKVNRRRFVVVVLYIYTYVG